MLDILRFELQDDSYTGLTAAQILAKLNEITTIGSDSTAYTWAGLSDKLQQNGLDATLLIQLDSIVTALPGGTMLDRMLSSGGVDFASAVIQAQLTAILAGVTGDAATITQAMLDVGVQKGERWRINLSIQPTLDEINKALILNATSKAMTDILAPVAAKNTALQAWIDSLDTSAMTPAQVQAYCDDLLASADGNPTGGV